MSMMAQNEPRVAPTHHEDPPIERLQAEAAELLIDASKQNWIRRRRERVAFGKSVGLTAVRMAELLTVDRGTVDRDLIVTATRRTTEAGASRDAAAG